MLPNETLKRTGARAMEAIMVERLASASNYMHCCAWRVVARHLALR